MSWVGDTYYYKIGKLKQIAMNYDAYDMGNSEFIWGNWKDIQSRVEFKADFDRALALLGKRRRTVIMALNEDIPDYELERQGFYEVGKFRSDSFKLMQKVLNGC